MTTRGLSDEGLRRVIVRLLSSTDANSSFWRFPLGSALRAANAGERDAFFEPSKTRRRGYPYQLDVRRATAVSHVYYRWGKGLKKHVAMEQVAHALNVSTETLRDWEKKLAKEDHALGWKGARVAGALESEIKEKSYRELLEKYGTDRFGATSDFDIARFFLARIEAEWSLEKLKADLRQLPQLHIGSSLFAMNTSGNV